MYPSERHNIITEKVRKVGFVSIKELAKDTGCAIATIRRDIKYLEERGVVVVTRGGVRMVSTPVWVNGDRRSSATTHAREKTAIGKATQEFILDGDIIIITHGSTAAQVARHIDPEKRLTVITNGLDIVAELKVKPNVRTILLGGIVDFANNTVVGPTVSKMLLEFNPSKIITGAGGISRTKGITSYDIMNSEYFINMVELAREVIVVVDHSKFDREVLTKVLSLDQVHIMVTDSGLPSEYRKLLEEHQITYRIVNF